jgi:amino acid transporter
MRHRLIHSFHSVLYIFFKFFLKSKVIPIEAIDLRTEFESIRQEREAGEKIGMGESGSSRLKAIVARMRNWI